MREEFVFSAGYKSAIDEAVEMGVATAEDKLAWYDGIISYALTGAEPQFTGVCAILWKVVAGAISMANAEYDRLRSESAKRAVKSESASRSVTTRWKKGRDKGAADACDTNVCDTNVSIRTYEYERIDEKKKEKEKESPNVPFPPTPPNTSLPKEKEINKEKEGVSVPRDFSCSSGAEHPAARPSKRELSKEFLSDVVVMWNDTCAPHMPRLIDIRGTRKDKLRLRLMELGGEKKETDWLAWLRALFDKCARTPFLWGRNDRGWRCDFGWLVDNDTNWRKVMEGRYDTSAPRGYDTGIILTDNDPHRFDNEKEKWK